jgi:hypothetical protein
MCMMYTHLINKLSFYNLCRIYMQKYKKKIYLLNNADINLKIPLIKRKPLILEGKST